MNLDPTSRAAQPDHAQTWSSPEAPRGAAEEWRQ
jgi:hypothetical protein